jgi:hypothetical protein
MPNFILGRLFWDAFLMATASRAATMKLNLKAHGRFAGYTSKWYREALADSRYKSH